MSDPTAPWTPERIQEYMRTEHGINWGPPAAEDTWTEREKAALKAEDIGTPFTPVDTATEWQVFDKDTHALRTLTRDELFDLTEHVRASTPDTTVEILQDIRDHAGSVFDDLPRDHPQTERETAYVQDAMKGYGVPAETRAQAKWSATMNRNQALAESMARHPSGQQMHPGPQNWAAKPAAYVRPLRP